MATGVVVSGVRPPAISVLLDGTRRVVPRGARVVTSPPTRKPTPPEVTAKVVVGAITIEQNARGGIAIYATDNRDNRIVLDTSEIPELMVALDGVLGNRPSKLTR